MAGSGDKSADMSTPARLPTFKGPRDLTLSSAARARRQFAPNIPPKRDKTGDPVGISPRAAAKQFTQPALPGPSELKSRKPRPTPLPGLGLHGKRGGGGSRGRGRGKQPDLVQSTSIFAEGVGIKSVSSKRGSSSSSFSSRGRGRGRGGSSRPSISTADLEDAIRKESRKESAASDDEDVDVDDDDEDDLIGGTGTFIEGLSQGVLPHHLQPVSLPLDKYVQKVATKTIPKKGHKAMPGDSFSKFLTSAPKGTLACLQMPHMLPFKEKDPEDMEDNASLPYANTLHNVKGGCIGKIQIRKSGRCQLILGNSAEDQVTYEVDSSKIVGFRQELAAVNTEKKTLTMIGKVQHKFVCSPDLDPLLKLKL